MSDGLNPVDWWWIDRHRAGKSAWTAVVPFALSPQKLVDSVKVRARRELRVIESITKMQEDFHSRRPFACGTISDYY